jgi:hypothetical protein
VKQLLQYDYTAVGHVTVDLLSDGSRRPGGSAFYSALQAARLGARTLIITQGVRAEIEELLGPYRDELDLQVIPARATTTLQTAGWGPSRSQQVLAWAGRIECEPRLDTTILHLAPVAQEIPGAWDAPGAFVGLTPQGLMREWSGAGARITPMLPSRPSERLAARCDAVVLSEHERAFCQGLIERAIDGGALVAITAEDRPSTILWRDGVPLEIEVPTVAEPLEDLGAGDVYAAALFTMLAAGEQPAEAASFATSAAAVRMQGVGAQAIGDRAAIESRLRAVARKS